MKNYNNFIIENIENDDKIIELSYFDFIDICNVYKSIDFTDKNGNTICGIVDLVKKSPDIFSKKSNKYHFLAAIKNKTVLGVFYKQLFGNREIYGDGYIISKGKGKDLFDEMRKLGEYATFSNLNNIQSIKSQIEMGAEIICITDSIPNKPDGVYNKEFTDQSLKQLMFDEKIYYKSGNDKLFIFDEFGKFNQSEFINFIIENENIFVIEPEENIASKIKLYFWFK
jgi:hypothetical protein